MSKYFYKVVELDSDNETPFNTPLNGEWEIWDIVKAYDTTYLIFRKLKEDKED